MVGTRQLDQLLRHTRRAGRRRMQLFPGNFRGMSALLLGWAAKRSLRAGAKCVLVGDGEQLPEIAAGGIFAALVRRPDTVRLTESRNQQVERRALAAFRAHRIGTRRRTRSATQRVRATPVPQAAVIRRSWWSLAATRATAENGRDLQ